MDTQFRGVVILESDGVFDPKTERSGAASKCPPEFLRKFLDLLAAGRSVASLSADLGVSDQTI